MSWRDAPLYSEAYALALDLHQRAARHEGTDQAPLGGQLAAASRVLLESVALSLTFPHERADHLAEAYRAIVRLRMALRLARDLDLLSAGAARALHDRLDACGRMIGGWRRRLRPISERAPPERAS